MKHDYEQQHARQAAVHGSNSNLYLKEALTILVITFKKRFYSISIIGHRSLKFCLYLTSITSKPKAHNVNTSFHRERKVPTSQVESLCLSSNTQKSNPIHAFAVTGKIYLHDGDVFALDNSQPWDKQSELLFFSRFAKTRECIG